MRRLLRISGTLLILGGLGMLAWTVLVWQWQDPFTGMYTRYEQHKLTSRYHHILADYEAGSPMLAPKHVPTGISLAAARHDVRLAAARYRASTHEGDPIGRIKVKRLGLNMLFVDGTSEGSLEKGPGRYLGTYMPGQGQLIYIAGHRTTYLAPFSKIDHLRPGDNVTLEMPYGTFIYRITGHRIVDKDDISVLESHGKEIVALQACHPRFFASQRYIAYAKLVRFELPSGRGFTLT